MLEQKKHIKFRDMKMSAPSWTTATLIAAVSGTFTAMSYVSAKMEKYQTVALAEQQEKSTGKEIEYLREDIKDVSKKLDRVLIKIK